MQQVDSEHLVNTYLKEGKKVLAEGAQGTLLDIDFGAYPYVKYNNRWSMYRFRYCTIENW